MSPRNLTEIDEEITKLDDKSSMNYTTMQVINTNMIQVNNDLREIKKEVKNQGIKQDGLFKIVSNMNTEFSMSLNQLTDKLELFMKQCNSRQEKADENRIERRKLNLTFKRTLIIVFFTAILSLSTFITGQCVLEKYIKNSTIKVVKP